MGFRYGVSSPYDEETRPRRLGAWPIRDFQSLARRIDNLYFLLAFTVPSGRTFSSPFFVITKISCVAGLYLTLYTLKAVIPHEYSGPCANPTMISSHKVVELAQVVLGPKLTIVWFGLMTAKSFFFKFCPDTKKLSGP